jgi:NTE family protein
MLNDFEFNTICISGGGTKGISFLGSIKALIDSEIIEIDKMKTFIGCSMGGIICSLLSLGFNVCDLIEFVETFKFESMHPELDIGRLFDECGMDKGQKLIFVLSKFINQKTNNSDITLKEHYELTNKKLILSTTNYTNGQIEYLTYENYPNLPLILACRMTSCLPLYFIPVRISAEDMTLFTQQEHEKEYVFVDGGVLDNFPIQLGEPDKTIGILINSSHHEYNTDSVLKFMSSIVGMISHFTICYKLNFNKNIIQLKIEDMELMKLEMTKKFKKKLINVGYIQTLEYIKKDVEENIKNIIHEIIDNI